MVISGLRANWTFESCRVSRWERRMAVQTLLKYAQRRPRHQAIKPVTPRQAWIVYFMYAPDSALGTSHLFTLERLKAQGLPLLVVCAAPSPQALPPGLAAYCDALYWKDVSGYDFSGYTVALREISRRSPGADVFVMNDSVFGPFCDLRSLIANAPWDLTGFTSSNQVTNHIQSYAFILRGVDRKRMAQLSTVFFPCFAFSEMGAVVALQETRLARVAARHMTVGALWYGDRNEVIDPTLVRPLELLDAGFPFLKRSLLGKHAAFIDADAVHARLRQLRHPVQAAAMPGAQRKAASRAMTLEGATETELT